MIGIEVQRVRAGADALATADAIFLTNSLIGVRPAHMVGSPPPAPSEFVERLSTATARFV
jgi:branched-chain amino acid aminotransferase/4-amino-4-deoxychorismate lyase